MVKKKANKGLLKHSVSVRLYQLLIFLVLFSSIGVYSLVQTFAARGGKPSHNSGSSLTYTVTTDNNSNGLPNWGDVIRFTPITTATTAPHVRMLCTQGGTVVYSSQAGYFEGYPWPWTQNFSLSSQSWTGGAADCTATMYFFDGRKTPDLATITFRAEA